VLFLFYAFLLIPMAQNFFFMYTSNDSVPFGAAATILCEEMDGAPWKLRTALCLK
jgi:hypothetical protein